MAVYKPFLVSERKLENAARVLARAAADGGRLRQMVRDKFEIVLFLEGAGGKERILY
jgi:hypothetical protein